MSNDWYFVSFDFKTDEEPPTNTAEFIDWLRQGKSITYYDNIQLRTGKTYIPIKEDTDG